MRTQLTAAAMLLGLALGHASCKAAESSAPASDSPLPAIIKLLGGRWTLRVRFEPASGMPPGTTGSGEENWRAGAGGKALLTEESWKAGPLDLSILGVIWWNYRENRLHAMDCNNQGKNICEPKDAADTVMVRWNGSWLTIEEPEQGSHGKTVTSRVTFKDITATSFTETNSIAQTPGIFDDVMIIHAVPVSI